MSLRILAIAELKAPLTLPAFLPTPQRRHAREALAAIAAQIHQLENSPARGQPAGETRPRPDDASGGAAHGALTFKSTG